MPSTTIRTEVRGLDLTLDGVFLTVSRSGQDIVPPVALSDEEQERLRLEMSKALLPEWNHLEQLKTRATARNRRYLGSWIVMCLAAFSAFVSYPQYFLPLVLSAMSIFLWWRAGHEDQKAEREAKSARNAYRPDWLYLQERLQEHESVTKLHVEE
jgi:hypothetical protein